MLLRSLLSHEDSRVRVGGGLRKTFSSPGSGPTAGAPLKQGRLAATPRWFLSPSRCLQGSCKPRGSGLLSDSSSHLERTFSGPLGSS